MITTIIIVVSIRPWNIFLPCRPRDENNGAAAAATTTTTTDEQFLRLGGCARASVCVCVCVGVCALRVYLSFL